MSRPTLARAYFALFALSTAFPVVASLIPAKAVSRGLGVADVAIALALLMTGVYVVSTTPPASAETDRRAVSWYRHVGAVPIVLLVIYFTASSLVSWDVLLIGLAWRSWLLMYSLPAALALLQVQAGRN